MSQEPQESQPADNPPEQENVPNVESEGPKGESQGSPSQNIISRQQKPRKHYVPETVDNSESLPWPKVDDLAGTGYSESSADKLRSAFVSPEHIIASVGKFQASHTTSKDSDGPAKDNIPIPPNTPTRNQSRRTAKRGCTVRN